MVYILPCYKSVWGKRLAPTTSDVMEALSKNQFYFVEETRRRSFGPPCQYTWRGFCFEKLKRRSFGPPRQYAWRSFFVEKIRRRSFGPLLNIYYYIRQRERTTPRQLVTSHQTTIRLLLHVVGVQGDKGLGQKNFARVEGVRDRTPPPLRGREVLPLSTTTVFNQDDRQIPNNIYHLIHHTLVHPRE